MALWEKFRQALTRTREGVARALSDRNALENGAADVLEAALLAADLGPVLSARLMDGARAAGAQGAAASLEKALLAMALARPVSHVLQGTALAAPEVTLLLGVNGSGKTTTAGKLAWHWRARGERVLLAAGDTFRAAAVDQLELWARRVGAEFYAQSPGADPAAVAFDACQKAAAGAAQRLVIDTAGRLQNKQGLMEELRKVHRVCGKALPGAPHRVLLVLDGTTGQNALAQATAFGQVAALTGLVVTKLDGSARAGAVLRAAHELGLPVELVGLGEGPEDLVEFDPAAFARSLVSP